MTTDAPISEAPRPHPGEAWSGLVDTARRVGHHIWVERQMFAWLGAWSGVATDPRATVLLGVHAARHGRHAETLFERLPELRELDPEGLVVPVDDAAGDFMEAVCIPAHEDRLLDALVGQYRVLLPSVLHSYRSLSSTLSPVSDGSLSRTLDLLVGEDLEEWSRGDALLRSLLRSDDDVRRVTDRQRELDSALLGCRVFPG